MGSSVTVFCASSNQVAEKYYQAARLTGEQLVFSGYPVFYGGGKSGLMGCLAETVLKSGGKITGVQPHFMHEQEWYHPGITRMILVEDMAERKRILFSEALAVVALAGGVGTLDEFLEAITLKQLGQFNRPIILVNTDGFFDPLLLQLSRMAEERFMREEHMQLFTVINSPEHLIEAIREAPSWDSSNIGKAQL
jgi:uncharacterized protein (TIGR00730 family)